MRSIGPKGFSLVEIMIVIGCMSILLASLTRIFQAGTRSSLKGVLRVETTLEARRILKQMYKDLKGACLERSGVEFELQFQLVLTATLNDEDQTEYSFLSFPIHGDLAKVISSPPGKESGKEKSWVYASKITYKLEKIRHDSPCRRLSRIEKFHPAHPLAGNYPGGALTRVLSERVQTLNIEERVFKNEENEDASLCCYWINLQLLDSVNKENLKIIESGEKITWVSPQKNVLVADFFEVVYPEYYNGLVSRKGFNPNWHSGILDFTKTP